MLHMESHIKNSMYLCMMLEVYGGTVWVIDFDRCQLLLHVSPNSEIQTEGAEVLGNNSSEMAAAPNA